MRNPPDDVRFTQAADRADDNRKAHRRDLSDTVHAIGIREIARRSGLTAMRVSRFANYTGGDDVETFYRIAAACGRRVHLR